MFIQSPTKASTHFLNLLKDDLVLFWTGGIPAILVKIIFIVVCGYKIMICKTLKEYDRSNKLF